MPRIQFMNIEIDNLTMRETFDGKTDIERVNDTRGQ